MAAVVVGVTAFSYLHNKKKVDFYHSIPVRREVLFAVQYGDGILIPAAAYLFGCLLFTAVAAAYGVPVSEFFGSMSAAFGMNLLYYSLVYGTVTVAMMMTGNIVIGLFLGTAVFFGFVPLAAGLLGAFADQFLSHRQVSSGMRTVRLTCGRCKICPLWEHTSGLLLLFRTRMESKWLRY